MVAVYLPRCRLAVLWHRELRNRTECLELVEIEAGWSNWFKLTIMTYLTDIYLLVLL